jgi:hypothetical protein
MQDRAGAEEADAGDDLRGDARRIAVGTMVGCETDLRNIDRQLSEQRRADADQNVGPQPGGLSRELALHPDGPAEKSGEEEFGEHAQSERVGDRVDRDGSTGLQDEAWIESGLSYWQ